MPFEVIDLFCGVGGLTCGMRQAGFRVVGSQNHCFLGPFRIKNLHIIMLIFKQISAY